MAANEDGKETVVDTKTTDTTAVEGANADGGTTTTATTETVPLSKFLDVKKELKAMKDSADEKERKETEKRGEFEKLYLTEQEKATKYTNELESSKKRNERYEGVVTELLKSELEQLPETLQEKINKMELDTADKLSFAKEMVAEFESVKTTSVKKENDTVIIKDGKVQVTDEFLNAPATPESAAAYVEYLRNKNK